MRARLSALATANSSLLARGLAKLLLLAALCGCQSTSPESSSESHWVKCQVEAECQRHDPSAVCRAGFCESAAGTRWIAPELPPTGSESPAAATTTDAGRDRMDAEGPSAPELDPAGDGGVSRVPPSGAPNNPALDAGLGGSANVACDALASPLDTASSTDGDYLITDAPSLQAAQGFATINGELRIRPRGIDELTETALPNLRVVEGSLVVESSQLTHVALPNLQAIGAELLIQLNTELVEVDLRQLQEVTAGIAINNVPQLARLRLDALTTVGAVVQLDAPLAAACELNALFERLALPPPAVGRNDCQCETLCGWLEASCP